MKAKFRHLKGVAAMALATPATADVIYSNLQNIAIPATYDGVYLNVETGAWNTDMNNPVAGWDINPYFGGSVLWNSPSFQPVRSGTGNTDAVLNLGTGTLVNGSSVLSTFTQGPSGANPGGPGYGGSQTHLGTGTGKFVAGTEGFVGFKLNGSNYGWMRVVLTNNVGGAQIKDWAYDNSGGAIATGNVLSNNTTVTLDSSSGSFTLGSQLGGTKNLVKSGSGTTTLTGTNAYSGTTSVNQGTLALSSAGTIANSSDIIVGDTGSSGTVLDVTAKTSYSIGVGQTLRGIGTVNIGAGKTVTINGTHAPGGAAATVGTQSITGDLSYANASIFEWDLAAVGASDPGVVADSLTGTYDKVTATGTIAGAGAAIFKIVLSGNAFSDNFWNTNKSWTDIFTAASAPALTSIFSGFSPTGGLDSTGNVAGQGQFTLSGSNLTWTAVPEPTSALAGLLLTFGLLRRRR